MPIRRRPKLYLEECEPTQQEFRVAGEVGGRRQPGSGSSKYAKGDVKQHDFLIECKSTQHHSLSVKQAWLKKISHEALALQKEPALSIEIHGDKDTITERDWIMIPLRVFKSLIGKE